MINSVDAIKYVMGVVTLEQLYKVLWPEKKYVGHSEYFFVNFV